MKDSRRENIKAEIYRHTIFSGLIAALLIMSSFVEVYASANLLQFFVKLI